MYHSRREGPEVRTQLRRGRREGEGEMEVGFLGLGIMGKAMAANLLRHGFRVTVWNRTLAKVGPPAGGRLSRSIQTHPIRLNPSIQRIMRELPAIWLIESYRPPAGFCSARSSSRWALPSGKRPPPSSPSATTPSPCSPTPPRHYQLRRCASDCPPFFVSMRRCNFY